MTKKKIIRVALVFCVFSALSLIVALVLPSSAPVGYWRSAEGLDEYQTKYDDAMSLLPMPDRSFYVNTSFGFVRMYKFEGRESNNVPLVLLPGRASGSPIWADNLPSLLQISDVYLVDLLGEPGMSVQRRPIMNGADQAAWLHEALQAMSEDEFHIVGLSIGGWLAANLAKHRPEHLASVTLIDPVFVFDGIPLGTIVRTIPASVPWLPKSWREGFNSYAAGGAPIEDEPISRMIEAGMQNFALKLPAPTLFTEKDLELIETPVLAIIAGNSVMHDPSVAIGTARKVNANVKLYDKASHAINGEYPEDIAHDIADFVSAI